ncbi:hypothetical protein [Sphingobium sp.]|uniref:hypothetical protein n=1 Tax=Sphingobium sp. TaxID=1912891 RepID=UPI0035C68758
MTGCLESAKKAGYRLEWSQRDARHGCYPLYGAAWHRANCLFGDAKTRGLNLEGTRIRNPRKLDCLLVVVILAIIWAYRCATRAMGMKAIPRKTHGRRQKSWFRLGFDSLRQWNIKDQPKATPAWIDAAPKTATHSSPCPMSRVW